MLSRVHANRCLAASFTLLGRRFQHTAVALHYVSEHPLDGNESKPPLVILHGFLGSNMNFRTVMKTLAAQPLFGRTIHAVDLRNHGKSPHDPDFSLPALVADIRQLVNTLNVPRGTSVGGKIVAGFTVAHPQLVDRSIVVDVAPAVYPYDPSRESEHRVIHEHPSWSDMFGHWSALLRIMRSLPLDSIKSRRDAEVWMRDYVHSLSIRQYLLTNLEESSGQLRWRVPLEYIQNHIPSITDFPFAVPQPSVDRPVLFIHGAKSTYVSDRYIPDIQKYFGNWKRVALDTGHWVHAEQPKQFLQTVSEFLA